MNYYALEALAMGRHRTLLAEAEQRRLARHLRRSDRNVVPKTGRQQSGTARRIPLQST